MLADRGIQVAVRVNLDKSNIEKYKDVTEVFAGKENIFCYPAVVTIEDTQDTSQKNLCYTHSERGLFYEQIYRLAHTVKNDSWRKYVKRNLLLETECIECSYLPMCYGGCVYEYQKHGSHACKAVKYLYEKNILEKMMSNQ